jgi:hypothetical protein
VASSAQINKALRQSTVIASILAQFIANASGNNVLDNGDTTTLLNNLIAALNSNGAASFLQKANNFSEIKAAGAVAQAAALTNLGLGGYVVDTGTVNAIAVSIPGLAALNPGLPIIIAVAHPNTGPVTINVNGSGALPLSGNNGTLQGGEIGLAYGLIFVALNASSSGYDLLGQCTGGPTQVVAGTKTGHAVNFGQMNAALSALPVHGFSAFTSSGSFTSPITGTIYLSGTAGGGGGGSSQTTAAGVVSSGASGGGAGQWIRRQPYTVTLGQVIPITIGVGGAGGAAGGAGGNQGGSTIIGSLVILTGGGGGLINSSATTPAVAAGVLGGTGYPGGELSSTTNQYSGGRGGAGGSNPFGSGGFPSPGTNGGATGGGVSALPNTGCGGGGAGGSFGSGAATGAAGGAGGSGYAVIEW